MAAGDETRDEDYSSVLDAAAGKLGFRDFLVRHRGLEVAYRAMIAVVGFAIMITGIVLIPLPGPGWLIVFAGLAVLATEFAWAERLLNFARGKLAGWTQWITEQSLAVRGLIGLVGLAFVAGLGVVYLKLYGVPGWLPVG